MYVDGFVAAVPSGNKETYRQFAILAADIFKEYGATRVVEAWGDDVPEGKLTSFPLAVKKTADETVLFSWIEWPDKATRDAALPKVFEDPRMDPKDNPMPLDGKRLIFGGFETLLDR